MSRLYNILNKLATPVKTEVTPQAGSNLSTRGGTYYTKVGKVVTVHIALQNFAPLNTWTTVFTLPQGCRPQGYMVGRFWGNSASSSNAYIAITEDGEVQVNSTDAIPVGNLTFIAS